MVKVKKLRKNKSNKKDNGREEEKK